MNDQKQFIVNLKKQEQVLKNEILALEDNLFQKKQEVSKMSEAIMSLEALHKVQNNIVPNKYGVNPFDDKIHNNSHMLVHHYPPNHLSNAPKFDFRRIKMVEIIMNYDKKKCLDLLNTKVIDIELKNKHSIKCTLNEKEARKFLKLDDTMKLLRIASTKTRKDFTTTLEHLIFDFAKNSNKDILNEFNKKEELSVFNLETRNFEIIQFSNINHITIF